MDDISSIFNSKGVGSAKYEGIIVNPCNPWELIRPDVFFYPTTNYIKKLTKKVYFYATDDTNPSTYG